MKYRDTPIFINCYNRLASLQKLVEFLEHAGCTNIILINNGSTYEPLLEYLAESPYWVAKLDENRGPYVLWGSVLGDLGYADSAYVYTDSDVVPVEECPGDFLEVFHGVLDRYPDVPKVGFSLKIDDLPDHYDRKQDVLVWEAPYWQDEVAPGFYKAPIDTTFALYRPGAVGWGRGIRTAPPYTARHTDWYIDSSSPDAETLYYRSHLTNKAWSSWLMPWRNVPGGM